MLVFRLKFVLRHNGGFYGAYDWDVTRCCVVRGIGLCLSCQRWIGYTLLYGRTCTIVLLVFRTAPHELELQPRNQTQFL